MNHPETPPQEIARRIQDLLAGAWVEENIMVITSETQLSQMEQALAASSLRYSVGESKQGGALTLVDFMSVKGLEKEIVFVFGIEDLYHRNKPEALFDGEDFKLRKERLSLRKVYVALTRPLEELIVYYQDGDNRFVVDLLSINRDILRQQAGTSHGL